MNNTTHPDHQFLVEHIKRCWAALEWHGWPDNRTLTLLDSMAQARAQLPESLRRDRWGQPLVPSIEAAWQRALKDTTQVSTQDTRH